MNNQFFVDVHILQTVPPSCVNRDDTGSPKTAVYGGVTRARVSSQAWKRAVRVAFREMYAPEDLALRTKGIVDMVAREILKLTDAKDAQKKAAAVLTAAGLKIKEDKIEQGTGALFFMSIAQAKRLAEIAVNEPEKVKEKDYCKIALRNSPSVDIALFGRMVADDASLNCDAASQVAHAISTHAIQNEYDYFTAVDDCSPEDSAGAGHLGTVEFNSSTMYRYACINVRELQQNLGAATAKAVRNFIEALICSMPTGKQNTFANRTLPDDVYVTIRRDQPVNMAGAFEKPVKAGVDGGYLAGSEQQFVDYAQKLYETFAAEPEEAFAVGGGMQPLCATMRLSELLEQVEAVIAKEDA